ncbi:MAG TPA: UDP-N-acetylmuramoyl-L-alanyl-D-glutamate--2,6-diaminopimelate ligase [Blastocatellia bacterium]|nr:UDP-N-acetylmuramoyl-L-alanyl-D-glutamate--2,6-diaminopimelate ligase [Blastocatellia bacterium]
MKLADLAREINAQAATGRLDLDARDVTHDSRACAPGSVFVAIRGEKADAHQFIPQAVERGAVAVISEQGFNDTLAADSSIAWIQVADARAALALAAAATHGHPSRKLKLVGVTGTNGKTTTAHLIDSIIRASESTSAMFGTIHHRIGNEAATARHTTPEAPDIQRMLAQAVEAGCRSAVMEVSSHAIELHRADALKFAVAVFTNLTRDHLDYHKTMDAYFAAKEKLFDGSLGSEPSASVINIDDEYGRRLLKTARGRVITYGFSKGADVRTDDFKLGAGGLAYRASTPAGDAEIDSPLVGRFHVSNTLASIAAGLALGADLETVARGIRECRTVAGRFEQVTLANSHSLPFAVIVDYAHTDDALKNVLQTAREVAASGGRVIAVFGCGGDRDRTKRAPMGEIAASLSDIAIVTSDNPRTEDPLAIIEEVEEGLKKTGRPYVKLPDRREAIFRAINEARAGDVVLIAGKGHETYQIIGDRTIHFDDKEVARDAMIERKPKE